MFAHHDSPWHPRSDCVARRLGARRFCAVCACMCAAAAQAWALHSVHAAAGDGSVCARVVWRSGVPWGRCVVRVGVCWKGGAAHGRGTGDACVLDRRLERTFRPPGRAGRSDRSASWTVPWSAQVAPQVSVGDSIHAVVWASRGVNPTL